jgi:NAD(P)H-dependent FMN reductase
MALQTAVVYGSARRDRQGIKAARFVVRQLEARGHDVELVDSGAVELPMLDLMYKEYEDGEAPADMERVASIFRKADGFIIVSGEYNHSIPAALKNLLDHYQREYQFKPSGLVTYSAGPFGGVRALVNLRGIMAELGAPSIPSAFPISRVHASFDDDGNVVDSPYDQRIARFLDEYEWYANAMKAARMKKVCSTTTPVQQGLCRGDS